VEVCFDEFQESSISFGGASIGHSPVTVSSTTDYVRMVNIWFDSIVSLFDIAFGAVKSNVIYIHSGTEDKVHNGDIHSVLKDLSELHAKVLSVLPKSLPDIFFSHPGIECGKYTFSDKFKNLTVVHDNGIVEIPTEWISLMENEIIINTYGDVYTSTLFDNFMMIWTCGIYYCFNIHAKKKSRVAFILTSKRLIVFEIYQRAGVIPFHLSRFGLSMRSYLPRSVNSGFIQISGKTSLRTGILTDAGVLNIYFKHSCATAGRFAKSLQMIKKRRECSINIPSNFTRMKHDLSITDFSKIPLLPNEEIEVSLTGQKEYLPFFWSKWHKLLSCYDCESVCKSFLIVPSGYCCCYYVCYRNCLSCFFCYCCGSIFPNYYCSNEVLCWPLFPYGVYALTCCLRPFVGETKILLTAKSVFSLSKKGNRGLCGCFGSLAPLCTCLEPQVSGDYIVCARSEILSVSWSNLDSMIGHSIEIEASGKENCCRRCLALCQCGKLCCKMNKSQYKISTAIQPIPENPTVSFDYYIQGDAADGIRDQLVSNGNWYKTQLFTVAARALTHIQMLVSRRAINLKKFDEYLQEDDDEIGALETGLLLDNNNNKLAIDVSNTSPKSNVYSPSLYSSPYVGAEEYPDSNVYKPDSTVINLSGAVDPMMNENELFVDYDEL